MEQAFCWRSPPRSSAARATRRGRNLDRVLADLPGAVLLLEGRCDSLSGTSWPLPATSVEQAVDLVVGHRRAALRLHDLLEDRAHLLLVEGHLHRAGDRHRGDVAVDRPPVPTFTPLVSMRDRVERGAARRCPGHARRRAARTGRTGSRSGPPGPRRRALATPSMSFAATLASASLTTRRGVAAARRRRGRRCRRRSAAAGRRWRRGSARRGGGAGEAGRSWGQPTPPTCRLANPFGQRSAAGAISAGAGGPSPACPARTRASRYQASMPGAALRANRTPSRPSISACIRRSPTPRPWKRGWTTTVEMCACKAPSVSDRAVPTRRSPSQAAANSVVRSIPCASAAGSSVRPSQPDRAQQADHRRGVGAAIERDLDALGGPVGAGEPAVELPQVVERVVQRSGGRPWPASRSPRARRSPRGRRPRRHAPSSRSLAHARALASAVTASPASAAIPLRAPSSCSTYHALAPATWRSTASAVRSPVASSVGRGPCASSNRSTSAARASRSSSCQPSRRTAAATSAAASGRRSHGKVALTS